MFGRLPTLRLQTSMFAVLTVLGITTEPASTQEGCGMSNMPGNLVALLCLVQCCKQTCSEKNGLPHLLAVTCDAS